MHTGALCPIWPVLKPDWQVQHSPLAALSNLLSDSKTFNLLMRSRILLLRNIIQNRFINWDWHGYSATSSLFLTMRTAERMSFNYWANAKLLNGDKWPTNVSSTKQISQQKNRAVGHLRDIFSTVTGCEVIWLRFTQLPGWPWWIYKYW